MTNCHRTLLVISVTTPLLIFFQPNTPLGWKNNGADFHCRHEYKALNIEINRQSTADYAATSLDYVKFPVTVLGNSERQLWIHQEAYACFPPNLV